MATTEEEIGDNPIPMEEEEGKEEEEKMEEEKTEQETKEGEMNEEEKKEAEGKEEDEDAVDLDWSQSAPDEDPPDDTVKVTLGNKRMVTVVPSAKKKSKYVKKSQREHVERIVYGIAWSLAYLDDADDGGSTNRNEFRFLATCAGRTVKLYKNYVNRTKFVMSFISNQTEEDFFCCEFVGHGDDVARTERLCGAGATGDIVVFNCVAKRLERTLKGHGKEVFDLKVHPLDGNLLLSASRDVSCRLWNVELGSTIAIFGGDVGHLDAVNSVSWHHSGKYFCSGGCDVSIKVWELTETVQAAISAGKRLTTSDDPSVALLETTQKLVQSDRAVVGIDCEHFPIFSTLDVHCRWVDCVFFVGDLIVSKSSEGDMHVWLPRMEQKTTLNGKRFQPPPSKATMLNFFSLPENDWYFVKFAIDPSGRFLAAGNQKGKIVVWSLGVIAAKPMSSVEVGRSHAIRNLAFSPDGAFLVATTDAGAMFRFDVTAEAQQTTGIDPK